MPNLENITQLINTSLKTGQFAPRRFNPSVYYGIADKVKITGEENERFEPQIINDEGDGISLVFDDTNTVQVYHQLDNPIYQIDPQNYGAIGKTMQESTDMRLIFAGNRSKMKVRPEDCAAAVVLDFPKEFTPAQAQSLSLLSCIIEMGDVNIDPFSVWDSEFSGSPFGFNQNIIYFSVKYRVVISYNKGCFSLCN